MILYIKHMVSSRCKMIVESELRKIGIPIQNVELGSVEIAGTITSEQRTDLEASLQKFQLCLLKDKNIELVKEIKSTIIDLVHDGKDNTGIKLSSYLSNKLCYNYTYLSNIFSDLAGCTIEQFIIRKKIEYVKRLLVQNELNLTQISHQLNYSSVAHLSNQFKKVTGISPTQYKKIIRKSSEQRKTEQQPV